MFVRKITVKSVCGSNPDIVAVKAAGKSGVHVIRVAGRVDSLVTRPSPFGEESSGGKTVSRGLKGNFRAICVATGEVFDSTRAFLPGIVQENIEHALANSVQGGGDASAATATDAAIEFGVDIYAVVSARDENKYEFRVKAFKAVETHSSVQDLLDHAPALPALAAPAPKAGKRVA